MDFYQISLNQIEKELNIQQTKDFNLDKPSTTYDDWFQVAKQLDYLNDLKKDPSYMVSVFGYKLVNDNHHIQLHYNVRSSN